MPGRRVAWESGHSFSGIDNPHPAHLSSPHTEVSPETSQGESPCAHRPTKARPRSESRSETSPPELESGSILEIDLLGTGAGGLYARFLVSSAGGDNGKVIAAAVLLEHCIERLEEAIEWRVNSACLEAWPPLVLRLHLVEQLLDESEVPGAHELALLVSGAVRQLLNALRDYAAMPSPSYSGAARALRIALEACSELADQVEEQSLARHAGHAPRFVPLQEGLRVNNAEDLARGLELAARAGCDMNGLEVGLVLEGEVAAVLRGPVYA